MSKTETVAMVAMMDMPGRGLKRHDAYQATPAQARADKQRGCGAEADNAQSTAASKATKAG